MSELANLKLPVLSNFRPRLQMVVILKGRDEDVPEGS